MRRGTQKDTMGDDGFFQNRIWMGGFGDKIFQNLVHIFPQNRSRFTIAMNNSDSFTPLQYKI